jgi:hypothetical protein
LRSFLTDIIGDVFCGYSDFSLTFAPPRDIFFLFFLASFAPFCGYFTSFPYLSPLTSHVPPTAPSRFARILGVIQHVLGALALIGFVLAVIATFWVWTPIPQGLSTFQSDNTKFGMAVGVTILGTVAVCFFLLAPITFVLGNRLFCRRSRVFCIVMAVAELLWGLVPGLIVAFIFFTQLSLTLSVGPILIALISITLPAVPIVLSIITIVFLSLPSTGPSFATKTK